MLQYPIYAAIIAAFITALIVIESFQKGQILKIRLGLSFVNLTLWCILIFFFDEIRDDQHLGYVYLALTIMNYIFFVMTILMTFKQVNYQASNYQLFIKAIKNSRWNTYYVVDQKENIKDISQSLLAELKLEKEEAMNQKFFAVVNQKFRFLKLNDKETNNQALELHYQQFKKTAEPDSLIVEEITLNNANGEIRIFHFITQPIYVFGKYKGRICVGEIKSDLELLEVEKVLKQTDSELESIRHKFIATLELSDEGIFFIDNDNKSIWFNDVLVEELKLGRHDLSLSEYQELIDSEDKHRYLAALNNLSINKANYTASYRINLNGRLIWIKEKGKRLFEDVNSNTIMGIMTPMLGTHFRKTGLNSLDEIKDEHQLVADLNELIKRDRPFQLAVISLKNVPQINLENGREVGNMIMASYIEKIRSAFVSESSDIYRISGLEFAFTITDQRKMTTLKQAIQSEDNLFGLNMSYGAMDVNLEVSIGIANMYEDAKDAAGLYQASSSALKRAMQPNYKGNGAYYKDLI